MMVYEEELPDESGEDIVVPESTEDDLDDEEVFISGSSLAEIALTEAKLKRIEEKEYSKYTKFLKLYFSSLTCRRMSHIFTCNEDTNEVVLSNHDGTLFNTNYTGYLSLLLLKFHRDEDMEYITQLYTELGIARTTSVYSSAITNYLALKNKHKQNLQVWNPSPGKVVAAASKTDPLDKKNVVTAHITSQFFRRNLGIAYTSCKSYQDRIGERVTYYVTPFDAVATGRGEHMVSYNLDLSIYGDIFSRYVSPKLILMEGIDLPCYSEFLSKKKTEYTLEIVSRVYNDTYIGYAVEYRDEAITATFLRPSVVLYPNTLITPV